MKQCLEDLVIPNTFKITIKSDLGEFETLAETYTEAITRYTFREEIANSVTHGLGTLLSIAGLIVLILNAVWYGDPWRIVSYSIFGTTLIALYLASTLYHGIPVFRWKNILQVIDHSVIYLLIAGTYTPFLLVALRGAWGWSLFGIIWGLAIFGITLNVLWLDKVKKASMVLYIAMGWLVVIAFKQILTNLSTLSLVMLVSGGLAYTVGVIFYGWKRLPYNHAIWHLFVLAGSTFHFFAVLNM